MIFFTEYFFEAIIVFSIGFCLGFIPLMFRLGFLHFTVQKFSTKIFIEILDKDIESTKKFRDSLMINSIDFKDHENNVGNSLKNMDKQRIETFEFVNKHKDKIKNISDFISIRYNTSRFIATYKKYCKKWKQLFDDVQSRFS